MHCDYDNEILHLIKKKVSNGEKESSELIRMKTHLNTSFLPGEQFNMWSANVTIPLFVNQLVTANSSC